MSRPQRRYSTDEIAVVLAALGANGGNVSATARDTGIPRKTIAEWKASQGPTMPDGESRQEKAEDLADMMEDLARRCVGLERVALAHLEELPDGERGKTALAHLPDLNRVGGTAIDKMQLLRNMPTDIHDVTLRGGLSDADRRELVDEINRDRNKAK